jgi:putative membrane protein
MRNSALTLVVIALFGWVFVSQVNAVMEGEQHGKSVQTVLQEIRASQGIGKNERIDCRKVSDQQFEELGEAYMDVVHPDPDEHEIMDRMMGGEGSPTLATMHRIMGARYLGCYGGGIAGDMMDWTGYGGMRGGMMGGGMMGRYPYYGHGGNYGTMMGYGYGYGNLFLWIVAIVLVGLVVYLVIRGTRRREYLRAHQGTPLEILQKRYASGEITKEMFEEMRKNLQ